MALIIPYDIATWPEEVKETIERHYSTLREWERPFHNISAAEYDTAIIDIGDCLMAHDLLGYHCTRLTLAEIDNILLNGMSLQNRELLCFRIDALGLPLEIAQRLKEKNQADDRNRAEMIWFSFFPPYDAGCGAIERFFRSWGGEALYNSHEKDLETGTVLRNIGIPCVIEAVVPIKHIEVNRLADKVIRLFMMERGFKTSEETRCEAYAMASIPADNIRRIIRHPEQAFFALTQADQWREPLQ